MKMGVVADDVTGANDIGIMLAKAGYVTHVYSFATPATFAHYHRLQAADICILDTNSRFDPPDMAYSKVFAATRQLQQAGCPTFFNKTCSVFRGNIGAEFDAMLDALQEDFAVVVLGFPKNGRITRDGIHYVHGQRLEVSEFRHDPMHPMKQSNLVEILQAQTQRPVALAPHTIVRQGPAALRHYIQEMRARCHYLIVDVIDQRALATIAAAVHDCRVLCGSSALAEELPAVWGPDRRQGPSVTPPPLTGRGVLCAAGSLMPQTAAQIAYLQQQGTAVFTLDTRRLFTSRERQAAMERVWREMGPRLAGGEDALFQAANSAAAVEQTRAEGLRHGLAVAEVSRLVSGTIADIVALLVEQAGLNRLVVAGGDTSAAVCARLGIDSLLIWQEIQPGLPSCLTLERPWMWLVLKSGSFGSVDFLAQAIAHMKREA
jgi:uncharacterized protein YgbK (DUF1537 family)